MLRVCVFFWRLYFFFEDRHKIKMSKWIRFCQLANICITIAPITIVFPLFDKFHIRQKNLKHYVAEDILTIRLPDIKLILSEEFQLTLHKLQVLLCWKIIAPLLLSNGINVLYIFFGGEGSFEKY